MFAYIHIDYCTYWPTASINCLVNIVPDIEFIQRRWVLTIFTLLWRPCNMVQWTRNTHLMSRSADDRREDGPGGVVSGKPGFAHAGAIVDDQSGDIVVTHVVWLVGTVTKHTILLKDVQQ